MTDPEAPRDPARASEIDCPACGVTVKQVASATLSLAIWQHWNWVCPKRESTPRADEAGLIADWRERATKARRLADNSGETTPPWSYQYEAASEAKTYAKCAEELVALQGRREVAMRLVDLIHQAQPHVCSLLCQSTKREGEKWTHVELCRAMKVASDV